MRDCCSFIPRRSILGRGTCEGLFAIKGGPAVNRRTQLLAGGSVMVVLALFAGAVFSSYSTSLFRPASPEIPIMSNQADEKTPTGQSQDEELKKRLTPEEYHV